MLVGHCSPTIRFAKLRACNALLFATVATSSAAVHYVDSFAVGSNNGTSWDHAFTNLQSALTSSVAQDAIWVAQGRYAAHPTDATKSFDLKPDVSLYGGFAGVETNRESRNWRRHPTILDGNIGQPNSVQDNTRQIVRALNAANATLDGFTIQNANATANHQLNALGTLNGSGMFIQTGALTVRNCRFVDNASGRDGGALYTEATATIQNCTFSNNFATLNGGAVRVKNASAVIANCLFVENRTSSGSGGAVAHSEQTLTLRHCTFVSNFTGVAASSFYAFNQSTADIRNSIFWNDNALGDHGGGILVKQNGAAPTHALLVTVHHTTVQGGLTSPSNTVTSNVLTTDPQFVDHMGLDLHLQSTSPSVNAGDLAASASPDLDGVTRPQGAGVDQGAFEFTTNLPPALPPVSGLTAGNATRRGATLAWTNPPLASFHGVLITQRPATQSPLGLPAEGIAYAPGSHVGNTIVLYMGAAANNTPGASSGLTVTNLLPGTTYGILIYAYDAQTNYAVAAEIPLTTTAPPSAPAVSGAQGGLHQIALAWTNPPDLDVQGVLVVRGRESDPLDRPQQGVSYQAGDTLGQNTIVYLGRGTNVAPGASTGWLDTNLDNNVTYGYRLYAYDTGPFYSPPSPPLFATTLNMLPVQDLEAFPTDHSVALTWINPDDPALDRVLILRSTDGPPDGTPSSGQDFTVGEVVGNGVVAYIGTGLSSSPGGPSGWNDIDLLASETTYYYAVFAMDSDVNYSLPTHVQFETLADETPPNPITGLTAAPMGIGQILLTWTNATAPDFAGVLIVRKHTAPPGWDPTPHSNYAVNAVTPAGTAWYVGPADNRFPGNTNHFVDTADIYPGITYHYALYAFDPVRFYAARAVASATPAPTTVIYVNHAAGGLGNGSSWANAFTNLQPAIAAASSNSAIWVARGTYKPTDSANRNAVFVLRRNLPIYGGFAGTERSPTQRRIKEFETILSGNIGNTASALDNSFRIVLAPAAASGALLDGFTLADAHGPQQPGGALRVDAPVTIQNCVFRDNQAESGGAVFNQHDATYRNCHFENNHALYNGGAVQSADSSPLFVNCLFNANLADELGGAMSISQQVVTVQHCTFANNLSSGGDAIYAAGFVTAFIDNSILWDEGEDGGGILFERPGENNEVTLIDVRHSNVNGGFDPVNLGNSVAVIDVDPAFVDSTSGNYRLLEASPCVDTAAPSAATTVDLDGFGRPAGSGYDMGAYEFGSFAAPIATGGLTLGIF